MEMVCTSFIGVFDQEIIDDKGEGDPVRMMAIEARCGGLMITVETQVRN